LQQDDALVGDIVRKFILKGLLCSCGADVKWKSAVSAESSAVLGIREFWHFATRFGSFEKMLGVWFIVISGDE
jgi:hypothetical protein